VDPQFFHRLRSFINLPPAHRGGRSVLYVRVKYPSHSSSTYGGTRIP
jgi:hypothetical protein